VASKAKGYLAVQVGRLEEELARSKKETEALWEEA
jgi:hypothetical protein